MDACSDNDWCVPVFCGKLTKWTFFVPSINVVALFDYGIRSLRMVFKNDRIRIRVSKHRLQLTGRLLDDIQVWNDHDDPTQAAGIVFREGFVMMLDVVERELDGCERLAASCGDGERKNATVCRGSFIAGSEHFLANVHDCI